MKKFSICIPVRNGWPYIQQCVESVLQQDYKDFDVHVLDNSSMDNTLNWLRSIKDSRVHIYTSEVSLNIVESWARIKKIKKNEFMTMIGHDDVLDSDFLSSINILIESNPEAGLYCTRARFINAHNKVIRSCSPIKVKETSADYLKARFKFKKDVYGTGYVMRSEDYDSLGGIPGFEKLFFADDALWLLLMQKRYMSSDPSEHCSVRIHSQSESASAPQSWPYLLKGINQFNDFLHEYRVLNPECAEIIDEDKSSFMLTYHRNIYIYALILACQQNQRISLEAINLIQNSLESCTSGLPNRLRESLIVKAIEFANKSVLRKALPPLWNLYCNIKNKI